jgi:predicted DNA repair protein MutK
MVFLFKCRYVTHQSKQKRVTLMAGASLLTLIDDIATILDDISVMTKVAAKKTAGVLGDDLALNAQQVSGVRAERELPIVWAVAKGSLINKVILVPLALAISAIFPWAIIPLLMLGGLYLCFEGVEKLAHSFLHAKQHKPDNLVEAEQKVEQDLANLAQFEKEKVKGAVRTDFILSAEIIVISLGTVAAASFAQQLSVLVIISLAMTVGVYGLVAGIVKLDDVGFYLLKKPANIAKIIGKGLVGFTPYLMKTLSIVGTAAMFLVGGGIIAHGIPVLHHWIEHTAVEAGEVPALGQLFEVTLPTLINGLVGVVAGIVVLLVVMAIQKVMAKAKA